VTVATPRDESGWRIDDLAHRSGVSVDTIRFWQRHGLLDPPRRAGRTALYGQAHLDRLVRIRDLQARHLSLAVIKQLLDSSRVALADTIFAGGGGDHTRAQLAEIAGLPQDLVEELESVGLLQDPAKHGRHSYDDTDVKVLQAVGALIEAGLPRGLAVRLCQIYAAGFATMQQQVLTLFTQPSEGLEGVDLLALQRRLTDNVAAVLHPVETILEYRHQRTVQAMTLDGSRVQGR
jgi:DNA-binding transcriptional MerR regulator